MSDQRDRREKHLAQSRRESRATAWLLPEWHPWLRDWSDVLRLSFLLAVPPLLALDPPEALRLFLTFLVSLVPRITATPALFDLGFNAAFSLQAWGNVTNVFESWLGYHDLVHFALSGATAALLYFVLARLRLLPELEQEHSIHQQLGIVVLILAMGMTVNAIYEEYEYFAVRFLHLHLLEYYQHDVNDLFFGTAGSLLTGALLALWSRKRWPSRRPARGDPLVRLLEPVERMVQETISSPERASPGVPGSPARSSLAKAFGGLLAASFLAGLALAGLRGEWQLALRFGLTFLAIAGVSALRPARAVLLLFAAAMLLQAWGDYAGAYAIPAYARWMDFDIALVSALAGYLALVRFRLFPEIAQEPRLHRRVAILVAAMSLGMSTAVLYQLYLWLAAHALGARLGLDWTQLTIALGLGWAAGAAAGLLLAMWTLSGRWTNRNVRPGAPSASCQAKIRRPVPG